MTAPGNPTDGSSPAGGDIGAGVEVQSVDDHGLVLVGDTEVVLDVLFDGRRIWSFHLMRDSEPGFGARRKVAWPGPLKRFLEGQTQLSVVEHASGQVVHDAPARFGLAEQRIAVVSKEGDPLGIDNSGRMARTFDTRSEEHTKPLLDSIETVLGALADAGVEAFPAYGTLLGAVREGALIGHDSDADLGYVSHREHPVDVMLESFRIQRHLTEAGYTVSRYSGAAFKVDVVEGDGNVRGLDVFGGFLAQGRLYLMGEVGADFREEWIFPLGTCTLHGRTLPAPAQPEHLLEAMYGPSWRVPDPAFSFTTPRDTVQRLNGWFRGTRERRNSWDRFFSSRRDILPPKELSPLAQYVLEQEPAGMRVLDVGAGRARDGLMMARRGLKVTAFDYLPTAARAAVRAAAEEGIDLEMRNLSLLELRSVLAEGARWAHDPEPRVVMANQMIDSVNRRGRMGFWRFCQMVLRGGGTLYLDAWTSGGKDRPLQWRLDPALVRREIEEAGAVIVHTDEFEPTGEPGRRNGRWVAQWH